MLKKLFIDVIRENKGKMDYIYDWTTKADLQRRKEKRNEENTEKETNKDKNNKNKDEEIESNKNDQMDRINTRHLRRDVTQDKDDKVESVAGDGIDGGEAFVPPVGAEPDHPVGGQSDRAAAAVGIHGNEHQLFAADFPLGIGGELFAGQVHCGFGGHHLAGF